MRPQFTYALEMWAYLLLCRIADALNRRHWDSEELRDQRVYDAVRKTVRVARDAVEEDV